MTVCHLLPLAAHILYVPIMFTHACMQTNMPFQHFESIRISEKNQIDIVKQRRTENNKTNKTKRKKSNQKKDNVEFVKTESHTHILRSANRHTNTCIGEAVFEQRAYVPYMYKMEHVRSTRMDSCSHRIVRRIYTTPHFLHILTIYT